MTLRIPSIFHGRYRDVKPRLRRVVKRMIRGDDWISFVEQDGMLDVATTPGLIVTTGPDPSLGREEHFQMWLLWDMVRDRDIMGTEGIAETLFTESLTRPWSVLGLVMSRNVAWVRYEERHHRFLRVVCQHWDTFAAVGPRYTSGARYGEALWKMHNAVVYVFANQNLPVDILRAPPEPGGLAAFLRARGILTGDPAP